MKSILQWWKTSFLQNFTLNFFKTYFTFEKKIQIQHKSGTVFQRYGSQCVNILLKFKHDPIKSVLQ